MEGKKKISAVVALLLAVIIPTSTYAVSVDRVYPNSNDNQMEIEGTADGNKASVVVKDADGNIEYINLIEDIDNAFVQKTPIDDYGQNMEILVNDGTGIAEKTVDAPRPGNVVGEHILTGMYVSDGGTEIGFGDVLKLELNDNDTRAKIYAVLTAVYDENGVLLEAKSYVPEADTEDRESLSIKLYAPEEITAQEMKIFVFDENMQPYFETLSYDIKKGDAIYVSPKGNDENGDGSAEKPLKTIQVALNRVYYGGIENAVICLADGEYAVENSGLTLKGYNNIRITALGDNAVITGETNLPAEKFSISTDSRIPATAQGKVYEYNLGADGYKGYGEEVLRSGSGKHTPRVSFNINGEMCTNARWPNNDEFAKVVSINKTDSGLSFTTDYDGTANWATADNAHLFGYWKYNWHEDTLKISSVSGNTVVSNNTPTYNAVDDAWYFVYNLLEELDAPGEWFIDKNTDKLYVYPPKGDSIEDAYVSFNENALITHEKCQNVVIDGIKIRSGLGRGVVVSNSTGCEIKGCEITDFGDNAVEFLNTSDCGIYSSDIHDVAQKAIRVSNKNWNTLEDSKTVIENNKIFNYAKQARAYSPAIDLDWSVGAYIRNNEFFDATTVAVGSVGFTTLIENNKFHDVCLDASDYGAIYSYHWYTGAGNIIRNNEFYNLEGKDAPISGSTVGVYLDELSSGFEITGNIFRNVDVPLLSNGGRRIKFENNILMDIPEKNTGYYTYMYPCGVHQYAGDTAWNNTLSFIELFPIHSEPYKEIYPELDALDIESDNARYPADISYKNNVIHNHGVSFFDRWSEDKTAKYAKGIYVDNPVDSSGKSLNITFANNKVINEDLGFVNEMGGNYSLSADSAVFEQISGFEAIDYDSIGNYKDNYRK